MRCFLLYHLLILHCIVAESAAFVISEFMAVNHTAHADEWGEFDDWVEIYNPQATSQDLGGVYLSDDGEDPNRWQFPVGTSVPAMGHVIVWLDNDTEQGPLHAPFRLRGAGGCLILTDSDGSTLLDDISYPAQHPDIAFGRATIEEEATAYLLRPTPGELNDPKGVSAIGGVNYSHPAGVFRETIHVTLSTATDGGVIRYTTDGRAPSVFSGTNYTTPITISTSTCLRAHVSVKGQVVSPLATQIYLAVDEAVHGFDSNLPIVLIDARGHDFSRDTSLSEGFPQSPVCSAFFETDENGRTLITHAPTHLGRAGMNVRGASSRGWPKKQFKFETWGEADEDRDISLLGMPADADWILAAPYFDRSLMRNEITFRWWEKLGYYSPRTRYLELFVDMNGDERFTMEDYQGIYLLTEKIKASADRLDLSEDAYIVEATNVNQDWTSARGIRLKHVDPSESDDAPDRKQAVRAHYNMVEEAVLDDDFMNLDTGYREVLHLPSHIDYDIMRELSRNIDGASTFLHLDDAGKVRMGPLWDYNQAFGLTRLFDPVPGWRTDGWNVPYMTNSAHWMKWWNHLGNDPEYQQQWEDRWVELRQGAFTNDNLLGDIGTIATMLEESAQRNFERWDTLGKAIWVTGGSTRADPGESERDTYAKEVAFVREWLMARLAWIDSQVASPPAFSKSEGSVPNGFPLELVQGMGFKPTSGTLYYTMDGSDPRARGGAISQQAIAYREPIILSADVEIVARTRSLFGGWGTLSRAKYLTGTEPASAATLTVSEIHYNPEGTDELEFIELTNRGNIPIDLTKLHLVGAVDFTFSIQSLAPGAVTLIVEDREAFLERYQIDERLVSGQWVGALSNGGEELRMIQDDGALILSFTYRDSADWPSLADGGGHSLERISISEDDLDASAAWRASFQKGGSPGLLRAEGLSYAEWQQSFGADHVGDPEADSDNDGHGNLIEFALGTSPIDAKEYPLIVVNRIDDELEIGYPKTALRNVTILLETSADLQRWESANVLGGNESQDQMTVRIRTDLVAPSSFVRLKASQ